MGVTERDRDAIRLAYDLRFPTIEDAATCIFGNWQVAQRRLAALEKAGFLRSFPVPNGTRGHPTKVYFLNRKRRHDMQIMLGYELDLNNMVASPPSNALVARHVLELNNVLSAFIAATNDRGFGFSFVPEYRPSCGKGRLTRLLDEKVRDPRNPKRIVTYRRDAVCCITTPRGRALFEIEYDRGKESLSSAAGRKVTLDRKIVLFMEGLRTRRFDRYSRQEFFGFPFQTSRLLIITSSKARVAHIADRCLSLETSGMVYLGSIEDIAPPTVLGPIWRVPYGNGSVMKPIVGEV